MKKILLVFGLMLVLTSFKSESGFKNQKEVLIKSFMYNEVDEMNLHVNSCIESGFQLESINGAGSNSIWMVVMIRY